MRHDIQANERSFSTKEVAEQVGIATPTVRKYGQILERNGYEFFKDADRRIFVQSDIDALIALRDTERPLDDTAKDLMIQQKERLEGFKETGVSTPDMAPDTSDNLPQDPNQLKEFLNYLANELAATREMNSQLSNNMDELKTTVSRLQQDHHVISSGIGNSAQKTHHKIEKLTEQQKAEFETLLEHEKQKSEFLERELQTMRAEQQKEWRSQNDFNKRLENAVQEPKGILHRLLSKFRNYK